MFEDEPDVVTGPPESWEQFVDRVQRQVGVGARVFVCRQVAPNGEPFVMILSGGIRSDLAGEIFAAFTRPS